MASISSDSGHAGKKPIDQELPLVPFIDLLFCCVMFLLATAVWNQLGAVETPLPGGRAETRVVTPVERLTFTVRVSAEGFSVLGTDGTSFEVPRTGTAYDYRTLLTKLEALRSLGGENALVIAPDDGIGYEPVITTLDTAIGAGFSGVAVSPAS
jgi:biopolymer transport protein ExbD